MSSASQVTPDATPSRPWWWSPGPVVFGALIFLACVAVGVQGYRAARQPVDLRQRDQQLMKGSAFCDRPGPPPSTAAPQTPTSPDR